MICAIKIVISIKITQIEVQSDEVTSTLHLHLEIFNQCPLMVLRSAKKLCAKSIPYQS
jgi:hypothetical protein